MVVACRTELQIGWVRFGLGRRVINSKKDLSSDNNEHNCSDYNKKNNNSKDISNDSSNNDNSNDSIITITRSMTTGTRAALRTTA